MSRYANKSLGQHFLTDVSIARKIVQCLDANHSDAIVEVGPGKGALTGFLNDVCGNKLWLIEFDDRLAANLGKEFPELGSRIINGDFLNLNLSQISQGEIAVIGNFPYNISSQILFKVLEERQKVNTVIGMFQLEVAERIASSPGSKKYGILSVLVQAYYKVEGQFTVDPNSFSPVPKVQSSVIKLSRKPQLHLDCDEKLFKRIVKTAFNQRRKMLRNSLKIILNEELIKKHQTFLKLRPEQLTIADFVMLTKEVSKVG